MRVFHKQKPYCRALKPVQYYDSAIIVYCLGVQSGYVQPQAISHDPTNQSNATSLRTINEHGIEDVDHIATGDSSPVQVLESERVRGGSGVGRSISDQGLKRVEQPSGEWSVNRDAFVFS